MNRVELWTSEAFLVEARAWVADQLASRALELTGDWEQPHARPWSSAVRFETTDGRVWLKVNGPGTSHEPALIQLLDARLPGVVPEVLGVHPTLGVGRSAGTAAPRCAASARRTSCGRPGRVSSGGTPTCS
jgi:hypothetical protein